MNARLALASAVILALSPTAQAALVLEYIQVSSITAGPSADPAVTQSPLMIPGEVLFLQVALRDTLGSGPAYGQPGTVAWQFNDFGSGIGSLGLYNFFARFEGVPGIAVNPAPTAPSNARLVDGTTFSPVTAGSNPPTFTRIGGQLNFGFAGVLPDPTTHRIALFNLRVQALAAGSGIFRIRDPNSTTAASDNAIVLDYDINSLPSTFTLQSIDDLLFGSSFTNTYDLTVVVVPEPSALVLTGWAVAASIIRRKRLRTVKPG